MLKHQDCANDLSGAYLHDFGSRKNVTITSDVISSERPPKEQI